MIGQAISEVARRYTSLDARPHGGSGEGRRAPGFQSRPPLNLHVAALRDVRSVPDELTGLGLHNALTFLRTWANWTRRCRNQADAPAGKDDLTKETGYLLANLDWITRQNWLVTFWCELRHVQAQLRSATGEPNPKPVGFCIEPLDDDWCRHPLFPPPLGEANVVCRGCGGVYDVLRQIKLKIQNEKDENACQECGHHVNQHDNDGNGRHCNVRWCQCHGLVGATTTGAT